MGGRRRAHRDANRTVQGHDEDAHLLGHLAGAPRIGGEDGDEEEYEEDEEYEEEDEDGDEEDEEYEEDGEEEEEEYEEDEEWEDAEDEEEEDD